MEGLNLHAHGRYPETCWFPLLAVCFRQRRNHSAAAGQPERLARTGKHHYLNVLARNRSIGSWSRYKVPLPTCRYLCENSAHSPT